MWQKLKNILTQFKTENNAVLNNDKLVELDNCTPESEESVFITKFNDCGGKFIYCDSNLEVSDSLKNIIAENNLQSIICFNEQLQEILSLNNIDFCKNINPSNKEIDFMFLNCENLIAFDGSIMVSSDQIKFLKLSEITKNLIVFAHYNQITTNLSSALRQIKSEKGNNLPSNITTIKAIKTGGFQDLSILKNIYLLMIDTVK